MLTCTECVHAEVCKLRAEFGEYAEQCEYFFKKIPKPHGRLIDADELKRNQSLFLGGYVFYQGDIDDAPTIIEAEVSEEAEE